MLTPERHQLILDALKEKGVIKLQEILELTDASESTIRRDLSHLEERKLLKRVHGGASLLQNKSAEPSVIEKSSKNTHEKKKIAEYAAGLVKNGDCIYIDAGTTTFEMIPFLLHKNVVIVTNGLPHLQALMEQQHPLYLIGGSVKQKTGALIGQGALVSLQQYRFDKCFMGVNGIHPVYGYTTPDPEEALIKKMAIDLSQNAYILSDDSKFMEVSFAKVADLSEAAIITNATSEDYTIQAKLEEKTEVKVVSP
ncbi:DeoR/GlpR family DNA-binding transcription regulator [Priestia koreensis]|uniref:DeoR faimly transcriptional regulator n=1 Tax=Priestia koreensis TaxID=284581 RepID=A0A0M0KWH2_9BACI|nr:DeoR/GlpR family DNA-binding transcription regulator [Priestia koreensis]KOO42942.1 DeoR faimly transcriptional regulator [Priestia koreensis]